MVDKRLKIGLEEFENFEDIFDNIEKNKDYISERIENNLKPKVAFGGPYNRALIKDKNYFYCTCGYSKNQPFCDGESHQGTGFKPLKFCPNTGQICYYICGCKYNSIESGPYCDGSHNQAPW